MTQSWQSFSKRHFPSLMDLVKWIRTTYELEADAGERFMPRSIPIELCRYLFRGEPGAFPESLPSNARRIAADLTKSTSDIVLDRTFSERRNLLILHTLTYLPRANVRWAQ